MPVSKLLYGKVGSWPKKEKPEDSATATKHGRKALIFQDMPRESKRSTTATKHGCKRSFANATGNLGAWLENEESEDETPTDNASITDQQAEEDGLMNLVMLLNKVGYDFAPNLDEDDIQACTISVIMRAYSSNECVFDADALVLHNKMCVIMEHYADGDFVDSFLIWARRAMHIRESLLQEYENIVRHKHGAASEHAVYFSENYVILSKCMVSECYRRMGLQMLENDLLPHQKRKRVYNIMYDEEGREKLSSRQRSWMNAMLRNNLGSAKVATFIWKHGLPRLFDGKTRRRVTIDMLQSSLQEGLQWWAVLIKDSVEYIKQPELEVQRKLSSLDATDKAWRNNRKTQILAIAQNIRKGKALAKQLDNDVRPFAFMTPEEQKCLVQWETGQTKRKRRMYTIKPSGVGFQSFLA